MDTFNLYDVLPLKETWKTVEKGDMTYYVADVVKNGALKFIVWTENNLICVQAKGDMENGEVFTSEFGISYQRLKELNTSKIFDSEYILEHAIEEVLRQIFLKRFEDGYQSLGIQHKRSDK